MESKRFLVDTNIFIWWMEKSNRLGKNIFTLVNDPQNLIFLSVASILEIVIKRAKKKLKIPKDIDTGLRESGFRTLPIEFAHALEFEKLPSYHKDPFDRLLISQARVENLTLITSDEKIWRYDLPVLKA